MGFGGTCRLKGSLFRDFGGDFLGGFLEVGRDKYQLFSTKKSAGWIFDFLVQFGAREVKR